MKSTTSKAEPLIYFTVPPTDHFRNIAYNFWLSGRNNTQITHDVGLYDELVQEEVAEEHIHFANPLAMRYAEKNGKSSILYPVTASPVLN